MAKTSFAQTIALFALMIGVLIVNELAIDSVIYGLLSLSFTFLGVYMVWVARNNLRHNIPFLAVGVASFLISINNVFLNQIDLLSQLDRVGLGLGILLVIYFAYNLVFGYRMGSK